MRVFIAIPLYGELLKKIGHFRDNHANLPVRWLDNPNLHITLVPPQDLDDQQLAELAESLENLEPQNPFEINFHGISVGPNVKSPRLIWATGAVSSELSLLKSSIEQAIGFRPDKRFSPHVTLARLRKDSGEINVHEQIHWTMVVDHFVLLESKLYSTGAEYNIIETFDLA